MSKPVFAAWKSKLSLTLCILMYQALIECATRFPVQYSRARACLAYNEGRRWVKLVCTGSSCGRLASYCFPSRLWNHCFYVAGERYAMLTRSQRQSSGILLCHTWSWPKNLLFENQIFLLIPDIFCRPLQIYKLRELQKGKRIVFSDQVKQRVVNKKK